MRTKAFLLITLCCTFFFFGCEKEEKVTEAELPQSAKDYVAANFSNATIVSVVKEEEMRDTSYDVVLSNGFYLDFNAVGECMEVNGRDLQLPASVIPLQVQEYVQTNYANDFIVGWEMEDNSQDFELSSKTELRFDKAGKFLSVEN